MFSRPKTCSVFEGLVFIALPCPVVKSSLMSMLRLRIDLAIALEYRILDLSEQNLYIAGNAYRRVDAYSMSSPFKRVACYCYLNRKYVINQSEAANRKEHFFNPSTRKQNVIYASFSSFLFDYNRKALSRSTAVKRVIFSKLKMGRLRYSLLSLWGFHDHKQERMFTMFRVTHHHLYLITNNLW